MVYDRMLDDFKVIYNCLAITIYAQEPEGGPLIHHDSSNAHPREPPQSRRCKNA